MSTSQKKGKKRPKSYYKKCSNVKKKRHNALEVGLHGFLLTCNSHEKDAVREAYSILNEYADQLYGPEQVKPTKEGDVNDSPEEANEEDEDDIEKALQREVMNLKDTAKIERRFQNIETKANNCIFIKTTLENPNELAHNIFSDLESKKVQKTRYAIRMLPINETCKAIMTDIEKHSKKLFLTHFQTPIGSGLGFSIIFKLRNNNSICRIDVQTSLGQIIKQMNPLHYVKHTDPDIVVIVEIIGSICCMGILKDFYKFKKYNLHEVIKDKPIMSTAVTVSDEAAEETVEVHESAKYTDIEESNIAKNKEKSNIENNDTQNGASVNGTENKERVFELENIKHQAESVANKEPENLDMFVKPDVENAGKNHSKNETVSEPLNMDNNEQSSSENNPCEADITSNI